MRARSVPMPVITTSSVSPGFIHSRPEQFLAVGGETQKFHFTPPFAAMSRFEVLQTGELVTAASQNLIMSLLVTVTCAAKPGPWANCHTVSCSA